MHPTPTPPPATSNPNSNLDTRLDAILRRVPPIIRLPRPKERCPYTGQSRSSLVELIAPCERNSYHPPVAATYLKKNERARRGVWLIPAENLFRYLLSQETKTAASYAAMQLERKESQTAKN